MDTKQKILKGLENIYWIPSVEQFTITPNYPSSYEQRFGNISRTSLSFAPYIIDGNKIDEFHEFLKGWGFEDAHQYNIKEYGRGDYFNKNLKMSLDAAFSGGNGSKSDEDETDDDDAPTLSDENMVLFFCPWMANRTRIRNFITELVQSDLLYEPNPEKKFYMIAQNNNGLYKKQTSFKNLEIKDDRFDLYYGRDFPHEKMLQFFDDKSNNLMIFYGRPGSGKTNYIKNLIMQCDKDVIYIPPSMVHIISEPSFVSFMLQNQGCTLIVEDAEQILCGERSSATTNLLNLTDGFLRDSLKLNVLATMNADIAGIDKALLRKGRLHLSHHFGPLSVDEANKLAKVVGINHTFTEDTLLCDIFNCEEFESPLKKQDKAIGFGNF